VGDFVAYRDDRVLLDILWNELSFLEGKWLDDIVGRATLENIAIYLLMRLREYGIESVSVMLGSTRVSVASHDIVAETWDSELAFKRGVSLIIRGRFEEALGALTTASRIAPKAARAFNARGRCLRKLGRILEALADFEQAIKLDHEFGEAYRNRGNVLLELGKAEEAIPDFTRAITLMPGSALAYNNRGFAYQQLGAAESALADHQRAIELDPYYEEAYRDRAVVQRKLGRPDLASRDIELAESLTGMHDEIEVEWAKLMGQVYRLYRRGRDAL